MLVHLQKYLHDTVNLGCLAEIGHGLKEETPVLLVSWHSVVDSGIRFGIQDRTGLDSGIGADSVTKRRPEER